MWNSEVALEIVELSLSEGTSVSWSIGRSVGQSVGQSVGRSVGPPASQSVSRKFRNFFKLQLLKTLWVDPKTWFHLTSTVLLIDC